MALKKSYYRSIHKILSTTALVAIGLTLHGHTAMAENWVDHAGAGVNVDVSIPNQTNITQTLDRVTVHADADINAGWTVNLQQPSSASKYIVYDTKEDPTRILGNLNANGKVYIIDPNGVIFGKDARVDVGSIVATTGTILEGNSTNGSEKLIINQVGGSGEISLNGTINIADAGLAAFVAPTVVNNGVINARLGKIALAAGNKVTLDLYGDGLVEIAASDALENALVQNGVDGKIIAEGGHIVLKAETAKNVVNSVINMDGIVNASSVHVRGGQIILDAGENGNVKVSGKISASGSTGGAVAVSGKNIDISSSSEIKNTGANATTKIIASDKNSFSGTITAGQNSFTELSGHDLSINGSVDAGINSILTLDPANLVIDSSAASLIESMLSVDGATVNLLAQQSIDVNSAINTTGQTSTSTLNFKDQDGEDVYLGFMTVNLNAPIDLATSQTLKGEGIKIVNVADGAHIQNGIDIVDEGKSRLETTFVNVASGIYRESVLINKKNISINGAGAPIFPYTGVRSVASKVISDGTAFTITADNIAISNFDILSPAMHGIYAEGGINLNISGNYIETPQGAGIFLKDTDNAYFSANYVKNSLSNIYGNYEVQGNHSDHFIFGDTASEGGMYGLHFKGFSGRYVSFGTSISNAQKYGVFVEDSSGEVFPYGGRILNSGIAGVYLKNSNSFGSQGLDIEGGEFGILADGLQSLWAVYGSIKNIGTSAIKLENSGTATVGAMMQLVNIGGHAIDLYNVDRFDGGDLSFSNIKGAGIHSVNSGTVAATTLTISEDFSPYYGFLNGTNDEMWVVGLVNYTGGNYAVKLDGVKEAYIAENNFTNQKIDAIQLKNVSKSLIGWNNIGNGGTGASVTNAIHIIGGGEEGHQINDNIINGVKYGILAENSKNMSIYNNKIHYSYADAIRLNNVYDSGIKNSDIFWSVNAGISLNGGDGLSIEDNLFNNNFGSAIHGESAKNVRVAGNTIKNNVSAADGAIYARRGSNWLVDHNNIVNATYGIHLNGVGGSNALNANTIQNIGADGVKMQDVAQSEVSSNTISYVRGNAVNYAGGTNGNASVRGNTLNQNATALKFQSGNIDLTHERNTIFGGVTGIHFDRYNGSANLTLVGGLNDIAGSSGTLGTTKFGYLSGSYVTLSNNAFSNGTNMPLMIDATYATFDGFTPDSKPRDSNGVPIYSVAQHNTLEAKILHYNDNNEIGFIRY